MDIHDFVEAVCKELKVEIRYRQRLLQGENPFQKLADCGTITGLAVAIDKICTLYDDYKKEGEFDVPIN